MHILKSTRFCPAKILRLCYKKVKFGKKQKQIRNLHLCSNLRRVRICHSLPACFSTEKMGKAKTLTGIERSMILELHKQILSQHV